MTRRIPDHCYLCGEPCTDTFCHAHSWAAGVEYPPETALVVTPLHDYWMQRYTPAEVAEIAAVLT